ncbi:MAG: DUF86 domain-containing protein [Armatimonadetes bacterium]|nr:DUF86 domain-containing protein [Armatimonadota bacterium]
MSYDYESLLDILEAAKLAVSYASGKTHAEFLIDVECQDAVIRRLEIIGEAARRISTETRDHLPDLPWHAMMGMRNFLIHEYDAVDLTIVWDAVHRDLPLLIAQMEEIMTGEE